MIKLKKYFLVTRDFVSQKFPGLKETGLFIGCPLIETTRRIDEEGYRAYMHIEHYPMTVCVSPLAEKLSKGNLIGLFLHEFGHFIGGKEQHEADIAILEHFNIPISYDRKNLQYIGI